jgi:hypothetical protein
MNPTTLSKVTSDDQSGLHKPFEDK